MNFYSKMQITANKLLVSKGQIITLTTIVPGTYDIAASKVTNTTITQTGTGAVIDWSSRQIDGNLIKIGDKNLLLSPLNTAGAALTAPILGDKVTDAAGVIYTVVAPLKTVSPAGTLVLFDCNLRA